MRHDAFEPNTPEREIVKSSIPQAKKVRSPRHRKCGNISSKPKCNSGNKII